MGNYHVPFWRAVEGATPSLTLIIEQRLDRVRLGNLGNSKSVGEGVCELKIDFGPGYRVYFGQLGSTIVLLLCGGDKSTQEQDIRKAKEYWKEYGERENANER
ncbi:type II toxin-antitoxin system RelE/ParE family toxin [Microcoleus sp. Pol12B4]